jgi:exopolyphosphatase/guanosine-5'-triphosphate,3'-diphosphate pyrophosphatase
MNDGIWRRADFTVEERGAPPVPVPAAPEQIIPGAPEQAMPGAPAPGSGGAPAPASGSNPPVMRPAAAPQEPKPAPVRLAAIDIGTNSVRLMVVDAMGTDDYRLVDDEKMTTRLGGGLSATGRLSDEAMQRTFEAVAHLKAIAEGRGAERIAAVATAATREAENGPGFIDRLRTELGLDPQVISGQEEAELAYLSVMHNFHLPNERVVCLDIGGGSLELVFTAGSVVQESYSLPLGAVRMTEQYVHSDPISPKEWRALRRGIRNDLDRALGEQELEGTVLIGSGGTVTSLGRVIAHQRGDRINRIHGYSTRRSDVQHAIDLFSSLTVAERRALEGLSPDRADIILAGAAVVNEVLRYFHLNSFIVNEHGIREGLIMRMTREVFGPPVAAVTADWRDSIHAFGAACGYDRPTNEHVARLALALYDDLAPTHGYGETERKLVEASALLRNVGYHISYERHHIHSYHLIRHAKLTGFSPREIELIANIARYHRRTLPSKRHPNFARLNRPDRERVMRLGAVVRLVDGLDRSHRRRVKSIETQIKKNHLRVILIADEPVELELWGGRQKKDLLERAYGLVVTLEARQPEAVGRGMDGGARARTDGAGGQGPAGDGGNDRPR